jgi:TRAP-type C4-dicarboxylate transport system permease small subunit
MSDDDRWITQPANMTKGFLAGVDRVVAILCIVGFSSMAVVIAIQVVARYAFNSPTIWSEELAISLFVWSTMLAIPLGLRRGEHLTLDVLGKYLPAKTTRWVALITALTTGAVMLFLLSLIHI